MTTPRQPSLTERVASAAAWNTLLFPARFVVGLVASVLLFNTLTPAENGVLALLTGLAASIGLFADLGIERSLPRFIPEVERRGGRAGVARFLSKIIALKLAIVIGCIALMLLLSRPLIGYVVANEGQALLRQEQKIAALEAQGAPAAEIARERVERDAQVAVIGQVQARGTLFLWAVGALVFFGALYDVFMQFLTAYFKQRAWNVITVVVTLLQPLLIVGLILLGWRLEGVLLGMVITPVAAVALAAWQAARSARELGPGSPSEAPDTTLPRRFARFAAMSFVTQATTWFYDAAFLLFALTAMGLDLTSVGLIGFAYKFAKDYLGYVYIPFSGVLTPLLARIRGRQDPAALQETYGSLTRIFALLLIPAAAGLALLTPRLLALLYPRFATTDLLIYLFIGFTFAELLFSVPHNVLMVYERYRPVLMARSLALLSGPLLALLVPLAPQYALLSAAIVVGCARVLPRIMNLLYVNKNMGLRFPLRFVGRVTAATLAFGIPLGLLLQVWPLAPGARNWLGALGLAGLAGLGGAGYLVALRLLGGLDEQERRRILSLKLPFKSTLARLL